ncbi:MAG: hypothetical protein ABWZ40_10790 [Caulobacterales bacterium]
MRFELSDVSPAPESPTATIERLARELIEASRTIELLASRAAEQLEANFFSYSKDLRKRAEAHLPKSPQCELDLKD